MSYMTVLLQINVEKLARALPLHLLTVIEAPDKFEYLLCGIRLLHTLCELTSRHSTLDKVLLNDCVLSSKMVDLVINSIVALGGNRKESWKSDDESLIEATMLASTLHLLHGFISPEMEDIVDVLLAHSKVDLFIETAFGAVHNVVRSLKAKLLYRPSDETRNLGVSSHLGAANFHCQQAEAALQFLHSLCQHKLFSDRIARNKLYHLFEEDKNVSFLDEVVRAGNLHLVQPIASEVISLLKHGLTGPPIGSRASPDYPKGLLLLNAMRLADVFSDDSNFRRFFTDNLSVTLSEVFRLSNEEFVSMFCSSNLTAREDDATLEYDMYKSAGWVLSVFSSLPPPQFKLNFKNNLTMSSYAHQRTSLLVKIIANLHCFSPGICTEDDRKRFINSFVSGLRKDPSYTPVAQRATTSVQKNLCSLWNHADFLIPSDLDDKDLIMFRVFCKHLQPLIAASEFEGSQAAVKASQGPRGNSSNMQQAKEPLNLNIETASENPNVRVDDDVNEEMEIVPRLKESNLETSGLDKSYKRGKSGELGQAVVVNKVFKGSGSGEVKKEDEKQGKKRKRSIMSDGQMEKVEKAIAAEPDIRRNSAWIRTWAENLSDNGPRVTALQLRNWLNNRKARIAKEMSEKTSKGKK
ncbi:unnamed protein product [Eruca vesicaria subsp. sativa]|uniref:Homeobox domain-containing protein n=1 Tax=Eruca vesicaria subsp. sativa TaxID=29727 RepID=A0ABC8J2S1_ERUVS|nr:unnamed protein product [Eruca vesicaria subsp. sativa]